MLDLLSCRSTYLSRRDKYVSCRDTYLSLRGKYLSRLFGECIQPYHAKGRHPCKANENYPALHALLLQYVDFIMQKPVSTAYSTILLAKNSQCTWHLDKQNVSSSILTAIGPFTGGKLRINHVEPQPLFECLACHMKYHQQRSGKRDAAVQLSSRAAANENTHDDAGGDTITTEEA